MRQTTLFFYRKTQEEMVLADMQLKPGEAWEYCPREALRRVSKILKDEFDLVSRIIHVHFWQDSLILIFKFCVQEMNAGFENEFFLLKSVLRYGRPWPSAIFYAVSIFKIIIKFNVQRRERRMDANRLSTLRFYISIWCYFHLTSWSCCRSQFLEYYSGTGRNETQHYLFLFMEGNFMLELLIFDIVFVIGVSMCSLYLCQFSKWPHLVWMKDLALLFALALLTLKSSLLLMNLEENFQRHSSFMWNPGQRICMSNCQSVGY